MPSKRPPPAAQDMAVLSGPPSRRTLVALVLCVLVAHGLALLSVSGTLDLRLPADNEVRSGPMQTRWIPPPAAAVPAPVPQKTAAPKTRIATEASRPARPMPSPEPVVEPLTEAAPTTAQAPASDAADLPKPTAAEPTQAVPLNASAESPLPQAQNPAPPASEAQAQAQVATAAMPLIPLGALPPSSLLNYRLTGASKGLTYHATGELRWQFNDTAYATSLSVRAFLLGTRHWRSVGLVNATGLAPTRFSDSWRNERATHFDRDNKRVVFSSNAPVAVLEPGAQDQVSLYVQLAAAMAGEPQRFQPGTRLQIQTATVRDAQPWLLTMDAAETLKLDAQTLQTAKWVCQPRNRFDAKVEFWMAEKYGWLPVRIRITQVSGDFIDMMLVGQEPLPALPLTASPVGKTTSS
ncbi:DUF3108 domain-containing protein [Limnohabitans sp. 15K]|uniref:DUF3108 domain-containing protein n=1 Tax=Limnohabitans sp. 15K TaxID=1100706 RepID=UPI000C1EB7D5|nr:DUF3108 domain-containing protein [Limnohabitans sp. 15K]PIT80279.1 hypothetical protein B9Z40_15030 [Limnohabitans sp. 15K]